MGASNLLRDSHRAAAMIQAGPWLCELLALLVVKLLALLVAVLQVRVVVELLVANRHVCRGRDWCPRP